MESSSGRPFRFRGAVAALAALLVSVSALALPRPSGKAPSCPMSYAPTCCCMGGGAPRDSSAGCCRQAVPEEAAPSLQSNASLTLAAPAMTTRDLPDPPLTASLSGPARHVAPRARSAPLFLLFSALLA